jgi:hypothetical protein
MTGQRPLAAADYQDEDDPARQAAEARDEAIALLISAGWQRLSDALDVATIASLLAAGGWLAVRTMVSRADIAEAMRPATAALVTLQNEVAGDVTAGEVAEADADLIALPTMPYRPPPAVGFLPASPVFDAIDPAVTAGQAAARDAFIQRLADSVETVIDQDIRQGMTGGLDATEIAETIVDTLGLTPRQAAAIENYRVLLENGSPAALNRVLRDRRFDSTVQRAIDGDVLTDAQIDKMVARYTERSIAYRARVIARQEALAAANAGRAAAWAQYADRRGLKASDVLRFWQTAADERVCPVCSAIPLMNADGVPFGGQYATPEGPVAMPPQPHTGCRCTERFQIAEGARPG